MLHYNNFKRRANKDLFHHLFSKFSGCSVLQKSQAVITGDGRKLAPSPPRSGTAAPPVTSTWCLGLWGAGTRRCCGLGLIQSPPEHRMGGAKRTKITAEQPEGRTPSPRDPGAVVLTVLNKPPSCPCGLLPKVTVTAAVSMWLSPVLEGTSPCSWPVFLQPSP